MARTLQIGASNGRPVLLRRIGGLPATQLARAAGVLAGITFLDDSGRVPSREMELSAWKHALRSTGAWDDATDFERAARTLRTHLVELELVKNINDPTLKTLVILADDITIELGATPSDAQRVRAELEPYRRLFLAPRATANERSVAPPRENGATGFEPLAPPRSPSETWLASLPQERFARIGSGLRDSFVFTEPMEVDVFREKDLPIRIRVEGERFEPPAVLAEPLAELARAREEWERCREGPEPPWDGEKIWARRILSPMRDPAVDESRAHRIECGVTSYFPRLLFNRALRGDRGLGIDPVAAIQTRHGDGRRPWEDLEPTIPTTLGVIVAVITADDHVVLTQRGRHVHVEHGLWNAGAAELLDPKPKMGDVVAGEVDLRAAALRAIREEVCRDTERYVTSLVLTGFGVEASLYQLQVLFAARVSYRHDEAEVLREGTKDRPSEVGATLPVALDRLDEAIGARLGRWQPTAVPAIHRLQAVLPVLRGP